VVTLLPTQAGGGAATVTAGDEVVYNLTLTNGTANAITGVDAESGAPDIVFVAGNRKLIVVYATIVNDKCQLLALAAGGMCTFGVKVVTEDQAPGVGGLTADYTVTWGSSTTTTISSRARSRRILSLRCSCRSQGRGPC
jgi:hypothetical protein